jgi:predicted GNAT family acetyltransferase
LGSAALSAICSSLFEVFPTLSLYVNDFNERAYQRTGFEHAGDFMSILF